MKHLPAFLNTPARLVITIALIVLLVEFFIMLMISGLSGGPPVGIWDFLDPVLLTTLVAPVLYILIFRPMRNQQAELERQLLESRRNEQLAALIEAIPDAVFLKDGEGRWLLINESAKQLFQLHNLPWEGKTEMELAVLQPAFRAAHERCLASDEKAWQAGKLRVEEESLAGAGDQATVIEARKMPMFGKDGRRKGLAIIGRDITERKLTEQKIHRLAFYDALTLLPNRHLLLDRLQQAMGVSQRSGQHGALLLLDLDHFKTINDTQGHALGDLLLIEVAQRLQACVREADSVARLGGDEFVVMLEELGSQPDQASTAAQRVAEKICQELSQPYALKEHPCHTTPSIGISLFRGHLESAQDVLQHADVAMYQAKAAGRNAIRFFDPRMQTVLDTRVALETDLRQALVKQQFQLYYQIQVDRQRRPVGAEGLLRWQHPNQGLVFPAQFIAQAEDTGLIVPIGLWVLQTACAQLKAWQKDALTRDLTLAVNVSAKQFHQDDFVAQVQRALLDSGAEASLLKLELTESMVLENVEDTIRKMHELKRLGVSFSMDDFGTGYSSLQYLKRLPLDQIKIDQSFVRDITNDPNDAAIVQTIIAMTQALGLKVIAEGVETEAQRDFLLRHGCQAFQGYLFARPVPIGEFESLLGKPL
ncbi:MAG: EAL domain-containing protein [Rhodoferax sp.]|uniref:putative bifunctional diguanylate cyclase/phosphodiesterase n=1 Tax=Rhodoferax sp. TaxID=50421 RepID=UPI0026244624|nr:EAL domain-containing protein [Rhodoferax sp.]MDD5335529.1 EAL domain-containing protein [Rhodoferax sp.]